MLNNLRKNLLDLPWRWLLLLWLCWKGGVFGLAQLAEQFLPLNITYANYSLQAQANLPLWIERWLSFDGGAYLIIARDGYGTAALIEAYFPLFPLVYRGFTGLLTLTINSSLKVETWIVSGVILNSLLLIVMLGVTWSFFRSQLSLQSSWRAILALFLFPTAFFYSAIYTETLFMILLFSLFLAYQRKQWWLVIVLGMMLTASRLVGVFAILGLLAQSLADHAKTHSTISINSLLDSIRGWFTAKWREILALTTGSLGLISYMVYLKWLKNDWLYFFHVQSEFGAGRQETIILFPQVIWRYFKILVTVRPIDLKYLTYVQEFTISMLVFALLVHWTWQYRYKVEQYGLIVFSWGAFLLPTLTGSFSSMPRYVMVILPIYLWLGSLSYNKWSLIVLGMTGLLILNTIMFIQGYWVA